MIEGSEVEYFISEGFVRAAILKQASAEVENGKSVFVHYHEKEEACKEEECGFLSIR